MVLAAKMKRISPSCCGAFSAEKIRNNDNKLSYAYLLTPRQIAPFTLRNLTATIPDDAVASPLPLARRPSGGYHFLPGFSPGPNLIFCISLRETRGLIPPTNIAFPRI